MGWKNLPHVPYEPEQSHGAYLGLCIFALWMSRHHLKEVIRQIINPTASLDQKGLSYSVAIGGLVIGIIFIVLFCLQVQMSVNIIAPFFAIWFTIGIAITCLRAELGSPVHDLHFIGPDEIFPSHLWCSTHRYTQSSWLPLSLVLNRAHRHTLCRINWRDSKLLKPSAPVRSSDLLDAPIFLTRCSRFICCFFNSFLSEWSFILVRYRYHSGD